MPNPFDELGDIDFTAEDPEPPDTPDAWAVLPPLGPDEMDTLYRIIDGWCLTHETTHPEWPIANSLRTAVGEARTERR